MSNSAILTDIIDKIERHNTVTHQHILRHLQGVMDNTGEIKIEDVTYILDLSGRELVYSLKSFSSTIDNAL